MPWWDSNPKLVEIAKFSVIEELTITAKELGRGSYGTVYAAVHNGKPCVAKEMHPYLKHDKLETFVREINTLSTLKHPSIVQFLGVYFKAKSHTPILVMEMMWKNLYSLLEERPNQLFLLTKVHILYDVASGLQYLHGQKKPVVHRDLHPSNILLNENLNAKIADLGQAKPLHNEAAQKLSTAPGNVAYMAPETLKKKPTYDTKLDVFSIGCTIIHLVIEKYPAPTDQFVESNNLDGSFQKVNEADRRIEYLNLMKHVPVLLQIAHHCLEDAPTNRPIASYICEELDRYIKKLELEAPVLAKQHKQDKFSLLQFLQSQESQLESKRKIIEDVNKDKSMLNDAIVKKDEYISSLEAQYQECKNKLKENEVTMFALNRDKESFQKELTDLNKVNKDLTATYKNQMDLLREDVKTKQNNIKAANESKIQMQNDIEDLQDKLKNERSLVSQKTQLVSDLETNIQKLKADADKCKEESSKANSDYSTKVETLEQHIKQLERTLEENNKQIEAITTEKDSIIADLNEKLKIQELQSTQGITMHKDLESKYVNLQQAYKALQEKFKKQQAENFQSISVSKRIGDSPGSLLHQKLLELQSMNEKEHQQLKRDRQSLTDTFKQQHAKVAAIQAQLVDSKKKSAALKQQLEEKSYRLSTLESSLNELQESTHSKEENLKSLEEEIATLKKQLENNDRIQRNFEKDLEGKQDSLKRKEEELQLQKKEHADEINNLHDRYKREIDDLHQDIERYKSQIVGHGEISSLLKKEAEYKFDLEKSTKDRFQKLDDERKSLARSEKNLKRQIKHKDADIKEKTKRIQSLEKSHLKTHSNEYSYNIHWYPYLSLSVKLIRPSIAIIKDKVFVTGGYQSTNPQGRKLEDYTQTLEDNSGILCFHLAKCHCNTIISPVVLGALASVSRQCVLVSGADSVGNTLTGNVYVLCEEGSHDQWKEFSKPLPTPRILANACCYGNRWLIVCGGFTIKPKEESGLLEAVNAVEILDITKGEWYPLPEEKCPNFSTILCCAVAGEEMYVVGSDQVIKASCNMMIKAATSSNTLVWDIVQIDSDVKLHPFSVVEVNGEPMIIASMTDGEDDVTCVLMKDTGGRWRIMSKAVECQHCSAAVVTSSLELLLFGGSEKISVEEAINISQKGNIIPNLNIMAEVPVEKTLSEKSVTPNGQPIQADVSPDSNIPVTVNQPPNLSFTGPIHSIQFDHNGGIFQSPIHKVSLVVPPNALGDGEKVTVYMGAVTSGPFDLPEDCKLRSAVVWLSVSPSDVVFKGSVSVILPHSAVFTSPQHHGMMRFITCEDYKGPRYSFNCPLSQYEIDREQGVIELNEFAMVAIIASPEFTHDPEDEGVGEGFDSDDEFQDAPEDVESPGTSNGTATNGVYHRQRSSPLSKNLRMPPACYSAKLFWPRGELPSSFRADVYYLQNLPTELYKVDILYRSTYYEDNGTYPEIAETQFLISGNGADLQCVLPCIGSGECDCLTNWDVTPMSDMNEVSIERNNKCSSQYKNDPMRFSFKFNCLQPNATCSLTCCFELHGVDQVGKSVKDRLPVCLQGRSYPFIIEKGIHQGETTEQQMDDEGEVEVENLQDNNRGVAVRSCQPTDII